MMCLQLVCDVNCLVHLIHVWFLDLLVGLNSALCDCLHRYFPPLHVFQITSMYLVSETYIGFN